VVFFMFICHSDFFSQETVIIHYQRKQNLEKVILPNEKYNSTFFKVFVDDSIYSGGQITVKKLQLASIKSSCKLTFSNNVYHDVSYTVNIKNRLIFEKFVIEKLKLSAFTESEFKNLNILLTVKYDRSKVFYNFIIIT